MWQFIVDQIIMFAFVYCYFGWEDRFDLHIFNGGWAVLETLDSLIDWINLFLEYFASHATN